MQTTPSLAPFFYLNSWCPYTWNDQVDCASIGTVDNPKKKYFPSWPVFSKRPVCSQNSFLAQSEARTANTSCESTARRKEQNVQSSSKPRWLHSLIARPRKVSSDTNLNFPASPSVIHKPSTTSSNIHLHTLTVSPSNKTKPSSLKPLLFQTLLLDPRPLLPKAGPSLAFASVLDHQSLLVNPNTNIFPLSSKKAVHLNRACSIQLLDSHIINL